MGTGRAIFKPVLNTEQAILGWSNKNCGNLAIHTNGDISKALKNRENLAETLKIAPKNLIFLNQIHSDKIFILNEKNLAYYYKILENFNGKNFEIFPAFDAVISNLKGVCVCVLLADCTPILLIDEEKGAVAAIHAGRKGVMQKIVSKTALEMSKNYGSEICNLQAFIGPNIKGSCYEISDLNLGEFEKFRCAQNLRNFDMIEAIKAEFSALSITKIQISKICTHCDEKFYSYRRNHTKSRFCAFAMLK